MDTTRATLLLALALHVSSRLPAQSSTPDARDRVDIVAKTAAMVGDARAQKLAHDAGLRILNVTWEDSGRFKMSSIGPNISDVTIQIQDADPKTGKARLTCMPVLRYPNFTDKTGDVPIDRFFVRTGNEKGRNLRRCSLKALLADVPRYLSKASSWKSENHSLLAARDSHVLVSAQACFLPIARAERTQFNPVLFNYQSYEGDPAVLTILATREGTSITVIDNKRDGYEAGRTWGRRLFFNKKGQRALLAATRASDVSAAGKEARQGPSKQKTGVAQSLEEFTKDTSREDTSREEALSMVMLIQVPLKQKKRRIVRGLTLGDNFKASPRSDVENAVIGHGAIEGPFTEVDGLAIERDPRFPIRVTVQFYKATSNGIVSSADVAAIAAQIRRVYDDADFVGSLVCDEPSSRPTASSGPTSPPPGWWAAFWRRHRDNTGQSEHEALQMLRRLFGPNWPATERSALARALRKR